MVRYCDHCLHVLGLPPVPPILTAPSPPPSPGGRHQVCDQHGPQLQSSLAGVGRQHLWPVPEGGGLLPAEGEVSPAQGRVGGLGLVGLSAASLLRRGVCVWIRLQQRA